MNVIKNYNKFDLYVNNCLVLEEIGLYAKILGSEYELKIEEVCDNKIIYKNESYNLSAVLSLDEKKRGIVFDIDAEFVQTKWTEPIKAFDPCEAVCFRFRMPENNGIIAKYMENWFWSYEKFSMLPAKTQGLLINGKGGNICILTACGEESESELESETDFVKLSVKTGMTGKSKLSGTVMCVSFNKDPYISVEDASAVLRGTEFCITPLKRDKEIPEFAKYLGWCTWNAFYHDVTADGIEAKLKEFKDKNIPVKWVLIDDGWFEYDDQKLRSFKEDKNKFPMGLKKFISHIKSEYDIKYVGVWHAFNGYWGGIDKESGLYDEIKDILKETDAGIITTDFCSEDNSYKFFSKWHTYLRECGVDFIKVDVQGGIMRIAEYEKSSVAAARITHNALERSVEENFGGALINCMGMDMINTVSRRKSAVIRNSDDFFPNREGGFEKHLIQNAYNSIFNRAFYMCDFDMWWSKHESAVQSAVLRAVSGGPVYVSDKVGESDGEMFKPLCDSDGRIIMCSNNPVPSPDCLFYDFVSQKGVLKLINSVGDVSVAAAFNTSSQKEMNYTLSIDDVMLKNADEYMCYAYFEQKFYKMSKDSVFEFSLKANGVEIFNIYPIKDGYIMQGDTSKYINGGTESERKPVQ